jgi:hypothetical protein
MTARESRPVADQTTPADGARALRTFLNLDALASGLIGILLAALGWAVLVDLLGFPAGLLVPVGGFLVAYAVWLRYLATRPAVSRAGARVVIVGNLLWVLASAVLVLAGWFDPTPLGVAFVLAQAVAVAGLAVLQHSGLRTASALR